MKEVKCSYTGCSNRRAHWSKPEEKKAHRTVQVEDDFPENSKMYCSFECACYAGDFSVRVDKKQMKKIVYIDMDGVTADFDSAFVTVAEKTWVEGSEKKVPLGFFESLEPIKDAIESIHKLAETYELYFLSTPQWSNPDSWKEKRIWVEKHFGDLMFKRLILSHDKGLLKGHYLIDDRIQNGVLRFGGKFIHFGSDTFPDWQTVVAYLEQEAKIQIDEDREFEEGYRHFMETR